MPDTLNNQKLYNNLLNSKKVTVDEIGDFNTFNTNLGDYQKAKKLYGNLKDKKGFSESELGNEATFMGHLDDFNTPKPIEDPSTQPISAAESLHSSIPYVNVEKKQVVPTIPATGIAVNPSIAPIIGQENTLKKAIPQQEVPTDKYFNQAQEQTGGAKIDSNQPLEYSKFTEHPIDNIGQHYEDFLISAGHNSQRVGAEISKAVLSDIKNPLFPGTYAISAAGTAVIDNWQKSIPKDSDNAASKAGAIVPMVGMALATVFQPEIAPATTAAFFAMGQGEGLNHADEVEKESKQLMPEWKKQAYGIGYGAAMSVPWGGMLGHLLPAPVKKYMVGAFMKASPELIDGLEGTLKAFTDQVPKTGAEAALNIGKQYLTGVGKSAAGMEAMDLGKQGTNKALGENVGMAQLIDGVKQSITSGAIFESVLFPFAKMKQTSSIQQRRESQGTVAVGLVEGKPAEIYQAGKDYYGIRPDGTSIKANESDYNNSMIIPTDVFNKTIETGKISPTIQRDVYSGRVKQMVNRISNEDGNIFVATDPEGNNYYASGRDKDGNIKGVDKNGTEGLIDPSWKVMTVNKGDVYNSLLAKFDQPNPEHPQSEPQRSGLGSVPDPRQQAEQQSQANIETILHTDGNVHTAFDAKGNELGAIKSDTPGGQSIIIGQDGIPKTISTADIKNRKVQTPDEVHAEQMQQYDQENQQEPPSTFNMNGKKYGVQDIKEDGTWLVKELDDNNGPVDPTGPMVEIDQDTQKKILDQLQTKPQEEPKLNTIEVGKTQYTFTPDENNSLKSEVYNSLDGAEKARADIETVLGNKNDVAIVHTPNPDPMQPDEYHVSVAPKQAEGTQENINLSEIFPENNQSVTNEPSGDGKVSENGQNQPVPAEQKIITQKFDKNEIQFNESDEVVPTDKMPLEKALPILQKKFKDHPKFVVQADEEKVEVPGKVIKGETKWDEDVTEPSTFKNVIKSIRIVPKAEVTNKLLDLVDQHNATPASRENKETGKQITSLAKELGYQTEKNASNQIRIFDKNGTIEKTKPTPEVSRNINIETKNKEKVPEVTTQNDVNQFDALLETPISEQNKKLEKEINQNNLQNGNRNKGGITGTSGTGEPITDGSGGNDIPAGVSPFDELIQSGNEPVVLPGGIGEGNKGIGSGEHPVKEVGNENINKFGVIKKTAKVPQPKTNSITGKAKEIEVSPTDLKDLALQYFVNGGLVKSDDILKKFNDNNGERLARMSYTSNENGLTIAQIAHNIEESLPESIKSGLGPMDVHNAVEDVINTHNSPIAMAKTLLSKYSEDPNQGYSKEWLAEQLKNEDEERQSEVEAWTNHYENGNLPTENELIELFKPTDNGQKIDKGGSIEPDRPVNPEGNGEIGQNLQGSEPGVPGEVEGKEKSVIPIIPQSENKEPWQTDAIDFHKKDNEGLFGKGDVVVARNKNRIDANNLMIRFVSEAKNPDDLYDIATNYFSAERDKLKEKYGNSESDEKNNAYSDLSRTEDDVFSAIDGTNAENNPEMAARIEADRIAKEKEFKQRELDRSKPLTEVLSDGKKEVQEKKLSAKEKNDFLSRIDLEKAGLHKMGYQMDMSQFDNFKREDYQNLLDKFPRWDKLSLKERQKIGILRAIESGEITKEQGISELNDAGLDIPANLVEKQSPVEPEAKPEKKPIFETLQQKSKENRVRKSVEVNPETTVFKKDDAMAAIERLKKKLGGDQNIVSEPETPYANNIPAKLSLSDLSDAQTVAGYFIESGQTAFSDYAKSMIDALGDGIKPYLKSIYNGIRDFPGMEQHEPNMTDYNEVKKLNIEQALKPVEPGNKKGFVDTIKSKLGTDKLNIVSIRKIAAENGLTNIKDTTLQEYVELAIISKAREIVSQDISQNEKFKQIVELYNSQPTISMRSSERIEKQQYSTPLPMSFMAGEFVNAINPKSLLEPSAGNGMMVFNVDPKIVTANEIDVIRLENLKEQGFKEVTDQDGTTEFDIEPVDAVITNPPFGKSEARDYKGYKISGLDEQMVVNALENLSDKGRASIIIGGHTKYKENGTLAGKKAFFNYLYNFYNVSDVISMDGGLYSKQGTSFPTTLILINGKRTENIRVYAPLEKNTNTDIVTTFDELQQRVNKASNEKNILQPEIPDRNSNGTGSRSGNGRTTSPERTGTLDFNGTATGSNQPGNGQAGNDRPTNRSEGTPKPNDGNGRGSDTPERNQGNDDPGNMEGAGGIPPEDTSKLLNRPDELAGDKVEIDLTKEKSPYPARSKSAQIGSVVPTNVAQTLSDVLSVFKDIDEYTRIKLGYNSKDELFNALSAEQIDGVAMAINQIENDGALIIGDMTGIGKGRQAAAILRYAHLQGKKPIFVTEKAHLFSDIYRDLRDIGSADLKPFIFNSKGQKSDPTIVDENGVVIYTPLSEAIKRPIFQGNSIPSNYDYAVLTYSQLNAAAGKPSVKKDFFSTILEDNILVLDESHNAGGEGNTGTFLTGVMPSVKGVVFLSGTFAKRADNMPIYAMKTAMSDTNMSNAELIEAIKTGGVPLQEIMSKNLTQSGQMIRRERDFAGVTIDWKTIEDADTHFKAYDSTIKVFNDLIQFQREYIDPIIEEKNAELAEMQGGAEHTAGTSDFGINNVPFASKTFNLTRQLLFSLKAKNIANEAIEELKAGRRPVIAVANTMEGFMNELGGIGEKISNYDFSTTLMKGLHGLFRFTETDGMGDHQNLVLTVADLPKDAQDRYYEIEDFIKNMSVGISISPIDIIKDAVTKAGYSIGEMTGRSNELVFNPDGTAQIQKRTNTDKKKLTRDFNAGKLDALIINQSASTGISLHASEKVADQRQRIMLSAQTQLDVNTEVQMRGRIDRTGQVVRGAYRYILSPIPAEQRMTMMFKVKLKSLDANTTSSQKSKTNEIEIVDFLNKYGDKISVDHLKEDSELNEKLLDPMKFEGKSEADIESFVAPESAALKIAGRVALLPINEQQKFYDEITEKYNTLINYLNDTNSNDLEITTLPLRAETKEKVVVVQGKGGDNPFAQDSYREKVEIDVLKKPLKSEEILKEIAKHTDGLDQVEYRNGLIEKLDKYSNDLIETEIQKSNDDYNSKEKARIDKANKIFDKQKITDSEERGRMLENYLNTSQNIHDTALVGRVDKIRRKADGIRRVFNMFSVGKVVVVPNTSDVSLNTAYSEGVLMGYKIGDKMNPSTITAVFATLDSRRKIEVPLSKIDFLNASYAETMQMRSGIKTTLDNWDEKIPTKSRRTGYIITGNILQAFAGNEGQLIAYTDIDGNIKEGILLPENYKPNEQQMRVQIITKLDEIRNGQPFTDISGNVRIGRQNSGGYAIDVPLSKQAGGMYFLDAGLRDLVIGRDFRQMGGRMVGAISESNLEGVLQYMSGKFNTSVNVEIAANVKPREVPVTPNPVQKQIQETPVSKPTPVESAGTKLLSVEEFKHTQTGQILYNVKINGRSDDYDNMSLVARRNNPFGKQRPWNKFSKGFLFNTKDDAIRFKNEIEGNSQLNEPSSVYGNYNSIQEKYPNSVVLLKVGGFYEVIGNNAERVASSIGTTLTRTMNGGVVTTGFTDFNLENFLPKLTRAGFSIAIVDSETGNKIVPDFSKNEHFNTGISNIDNNETAQPQRTYKTNSGETLQYSLFSDTDNGSGDTNIQREDSRASNPVLRRLNEGEFSLVEQKYSLDKNFVFDGRNRIESTDDVAYLFKNLESKGIENMFAAFVKDGKPTIVHISMGTGSASLVNYNVISDGISRFSPDKVYLIHNHPSGNLNYSESDIKVHQRAVNAYGDIIGEHIIINLQTGKYATFREGKESHEIHDRPQSKDNSQNNYKVYNFDKQVFKTDTYLPEKIKHSGDIAAFISAQRFSEGNKLSAIILDRSNNIKAYVHLSDVDFRSNKSIDALRTELQGYVGRFGASGVILSGTRIIGHPEYQGIRNLKEDLAKSDITLLDVVSNYKTRWNYTSQTDEGLMEPQATYGKSERDKLKDNPEGMFGYLKGRNAQKDYELTEDNAWKFESDLSTAISGNNGNFSPEDNNILNEPQVEYRKSEDIIKNYSNKIRTLLEGSSSNYFTVEDANGNDVEIRVSNHSANRQNNSDEKTLSFITERTPQKKSGYNAMINEWVVEENGLTDTYENIEDILSYELGFDQSYNNSVNEPEAEYGKKKPDETMMDFMKRKSLENATFIPGVTETAETIKGFANSLQNTMTPYTKGAGGKLGAESMRSNLGKMQRDIDKAVVQLKQAKKRFDKMTNEENLDFINKMELGEPQTNPELQGYADALRKHIDETRDRVRELGTGKLETFIENYFPHYWEDKKKAASLFGGIARRPFEGSKSFLKQRTITYTRDGVEKGLIPVSWNPVTLELMKIREMERYIMAHRTINELKEAGYVKFVRLGQTRPEGFVSIDDKVGTVMHMNPDTHMLELLGHYFAEENSARILNNFLSKGLRGNGAYDLYRGLGNAVTQFQLGLSAFHLGFTSMDASISKQALGWEYLYHGKLAEAFAHFTMAPIAPVSNILGGIQLRKAWFGEGGTEEMKMIADLMAESGGRAKMDDFYREGWHDRIRENIRNRKFIKAGLEIPLQLLELASKPILEYIVPRQKLGVFLDMARYDMKIYPNSTFEARRTRLQKSWNSVDNRMGQLVYDNLFWNHITKDIAMASVRSVGWNLGTFREIGGAPKEAVDIIFSAMKGKTSDQTHKLAYMIGLVITTAISSAIFMYLRTGRRPEEPRDYFFPKDGGTDKNGDATRVSMPSYVKDLYHYSNDFPSGALNTLKNKLSPVNGIVAQMITNKDYYGTKVFNEDDSTIEKTKEIFNYLGQQLVPFGIRNAQKNNSDKLADKILPFIGIVPAPFDLNMTDAEKKISEIIRAKLPIGGRTKEQADHSKLKSDIRNQYIKTKDETVLDSAVENNTITDAEANKIWDDAQLTPIERSVKSLTATELFTIYKISTPTEKKLIAPILIDKAYNVEDKNPNEESIKQMDEIINTLEKDLKY